MGGHGGLNILPQKKWNVYNFDNREKVRKDEEAAAKEEQLKREQSRKRDAEYRLESLRTARGLAPAVEASQALPAQASQASASTESESKHINLFAGIKFFDLSDEAREDGGNANNEGSKRKKMKKEEPAPKVMTAEDEKYRLGYGIAGKGVKLPWYLSKPNDVADNEGDGDNGASKSKKERGKSSGKKTLEELREERLKREKLEKERERALILEKTQKYRVVAKDRGYSRKYQDC